MATPLLASQPHLAQRDARPQLAHKPGRATLVLFFGLLLAGIAYTAWSLKQDVNASGTVITTVTPFLLLGLALLIALGFEFVNGFHDTANAVATVIYTNALPAPVAVVWSGLCNFLGVLLSSGAVAFGIIALLPVELILQVGSSAGFAMVFALLLAAIIWNLGTWWLGLPASSSHTLIGSIIGVGVANALMHGRDGTSGVDWAQASKVGYALLFSPLIGFACAALLLLVLRALVKRQALYQAPQAQTPPPWWIRGVLILTCTGVSFAHGSNDGQKGMGLIMLILVGTLPMAYALNKTMPNEQALQFSAVAEVTRQTLVRHDPQAAPADPRQTLTAFIGEPKASPQLVPALAALTGMIGEEVKGYGSLKRIPAEAMANVRNDMYLTSEAIRLIEKKPFGGIRRRHPQPCATVQDPTGRRHPLHSAVGQSGRGHRAGAGDHGWLAAHRGDSGREDRQDPPELCPRRLGRGGCHVHHWRSGHVRVAGLDHPRAEFGGGRDYGGQWLRDSEAHAVQLANGLGADLAGSDAVGWQPVLVAEPHLLNP